MMKYIVIQYGIIEQPIIFDESMKHSDMFDNFKGYTLVSAGMIKIYPGNSQPISCFGRSVSVNADSRGNIDEKLIAELMGIKD